jgi:predicted metal-binding protein
MTQRSAPNEVRKITAYIDQKQLGEDLKSLLQITVNEGAGLAAIINAKDVIFDSEIKAQADEDDSFPSIHWPLKYTKDNIEDAISAYEKGIFFQVLPDSEMPSYGGGPISNEKHRMLYFKVFDIAAKIESTAFYLGYHLAVGLGSGNCRSIFCAEEKRCSAMIKGAKCIHPYKGRPSLEAVGINASLMMKNLDFKLTIGKNQQALAGIVLIA